MSNACWSARGTRHLAEALRIQLARRSFWDSGTILGWRLFKSCPVAPDEEGRTGACARIVMLCGVGVFCGWRVVSGVGEAR